MQKPSDKPQGLEEGTLHAAVRALKTTFVQTDAAVAIKAALDAKESAPIPGRRLRFIKALERHWMEPGDPFIGKDLQEAVQDLGAEGVTRLQTARTIRDFLAEHATPEQAFAGLAGRPTIHPIRWSVKPYGICLIGHPEDLRFLNKRIGQAMMAPSGISKIQSCVPFMDSIVCLSAAWHLTYTEQGIGPFEPSPRADQIADHELIHAYLQHTPVDQVLTDSRQFNLREVLARTYDPAHMSIEYTEAVSNYCNGLLKHELLARFCCGDDVLSAPSPQGPMDCRYIFDSAQYPIPSIYCAREWHSPPKEPELAALFTKRREEFGWPASDDDFPDELAVVAQELRALLRLECKAVAEPYRLAYERSVVLLLESRRRGIPSLAIADVVIDNDFLQVPAKLKTFLVS